MKKYYYILISILTAFSTFYLFKYNKHVSNYEENEKLSGAMQSLNFWTLQRAYPNDDIPIDAYYKAYEENQTSLSKSSAMTEWKEIGPYNIGGRTISIAMNPLNPNTIFAGSASGGLWRSYSGGVGIKAWYYVPTGFPVLSVGAIIINPFDTLTMYIGTGEVYGYQSSIGGLNIRTTRGSYGIGILKTTDGGINWTKSLDWSYNQTRGIEVLRMDPIDPNVIYAGTSEGIYKTTNAGTSWNQIHSVIMTTDILINKENPQFVLAACGNLNSTGKGIYRSTDAGSSWSLITTNIPSFGGKILLADYAASANICWASIGMGTDTGVGTVLLKSTDFGSNWAIVSTTDYSTYQGWYSHFVIPHPSDPNTLLFGGIDMWKSTNGGSNIVTKSSWSAWYFGVTPIGGPEGPTNYSHADHHCYVINPFNPNMVYLGTDGGVFRTTDFGETYQGCNGSYQSTQFYKRFSVSKTDSTRAIGGMQDNATAVWENSLAWRRVLGGDGCCTQISPTKSDTMFGSSQYLAVSRSTNKGLNWSNASPPSSNEAFNGPFLIAPSNSRILYAGGDKMYKTTNAGSSWTALNNNTVLNGDPILSIAVSYSNPDSFYVTTAPTFSRSAVYRSTNGGTSFTNITGTLPDRYPVDITVDPKNSSIVYVTLSGFGSPHVYNSTNGGTTWNNIGTGLPDVPTSAIAIDPFNNNILYVGNDLGLFYSTNKGTTWYDANNNIEGTLLVMDLAVSPTDKKLFVATHGRGVFTVPLATISHVTALNEPTIPGSFTLFHNYPNPFNGSTVIKFILPQSGFTSLKLYDIRGRLVKELLNNELAEGTHEYILDKNTFESLSSGVYFYNLTAGNFSDTKKLVILK